MMVKKKLAIFDLDGTLFDTTEVNYLAYKQALNINGGFSIDKKYYIEECNGKHYKKYLPNIIHSNDIQLIEKIHNAKKKYYCDYLHVAKLNTHLFEIIKALKEKYNIAIVTTASYKNTMDILSYFKVESFFDLIITQEDVNNVKPNPEGFFKAMKYFDVSPQNTLIFEDSNIGIEAGLAIKASLFKVQYF